MTAYYKDLARATLAKNMVSVDIPHDYGTLNSIYRNYGKRAFDICLVLLTAPIVITIVGVLAFFISLNGGKPFYTQLRVGQGGRTYVIWKLRSMVVDADAKLEAYLSGNSDARNEWNRNQKLKWDPRITSFGRLLRKTSFDELPQLWNVLKGDMSLVGPRPMMVSQRDLYPGTDYYKLRPGITGPWQVSSRNDSTFAERATFDTQYQRQVSLRTDVGLILATVRVVLRATGH